MITIDSSISVDNLFNSIYRSSLFACILLEKITLRGNKKPKGSKGKEDQRRILKHQENIYRLFAHTTKKEIPQKVKCENPYGMRKTQWS